MNEFTVLVCGGRKYANANRVNEILTQLHERFNFTHLVEGGATGADTLSRHWAKRNMVPVSTVRPDWGLHGAKAGPLRNKKMLSDYKPVLVIAFPGGVGTANMVALADKVGTQVIYVDRENTE